MISVDSDNPAPQVKTQVEAGNVSVDVADVEYADAIRLCDEGMLEPIGMDALPAGADGTAAADDFLPGAVTDCAVATIVFSTVYGYDSTKFPDAKPTTMADFFDTAKFPGKRGLGKRAKANLEMALMADGVPAAFFQTYYEPTLGRETMASRLADEDAMNLLEEELGFRLDCTQIAASAVKAGRMRGVLLNVPADTPLLYMRFVPHDLTGLALLYADMYSLPDQFTYRAIVRR